MSSSRSRTLFLGLATTALVAPLVALAQVDIIRGGLSATGQKAGFSTSVCGSGGTACLATIVGKVLNTLLGLTGIGLVILLVIAGIKWMTADGEDGVKESKGMIGNAVAGLVIIVASYAIANFVVGQLSNFAGGAGGGGADNTTVKGDSGGTDVSGGDGGGGSPDSKVAAVPCTAPGVPAGCTPAADPCPTGTETGCSSAYCGGPEHFHERGCSAFCSSHDCSTGGLAADACSCICAVGIAGGSPPTCPAYHYPVPGTGLTRNGTGVSLRPGTTTIIPVVAGASCYSAPDDLNGISNDSCRTICATVYGADPATPIGVYDSCNPAPAHH